MSTITTRAVKGSPLTNNEVDANFTNLNTDKAELSGAAFTGAITTTSTVDGRDVSTDGSKLDGIEAGADVTDTTNVTAAGALMDSELTSIASVKALNQGVATTDSPTFAGATLTTADINAGSIDGTAIGASSASTGAFTTLTASGAFTSRGIDDNADATAITIDSSENVGIGRTPRVALDVAGEVAIAYDATYGLRFYNQDQNNWSSIGNNIATGSTAANLVFKDATGEACRLDGSGNLLVGTTDTDPAASSTETGVALKGGGFVSISRYDSAATVNINKIGYDGSLVDFRKGGTTVGSINNFSSSEFGLVSEKNLVLTQNTTTERNLVFSSSYFSPFAVDDGDIDLGRSIGRFKDLYLSSKTKYQASGGNQHSIGADANDLIIRSETAGSETARFTYGGNLLVGTTDSNVYNDATGTGTVIQSNGIMQLAANNGTPLYANRQGNDGDIIDFRKDGSPVGSIGSYVGSHLRIGSGASNLLFADPNEIIPSTSSGAASNGLLDLGSTNRRFKDLYLSGGVYLGGTGAANKLDDYEEGTFTPTSPDLTLNSPHSTSRYRKIGSLVYVTYDFVVPVTSATQYLKVNTPFAAVNYGSGSLGWTDSSTDLLVHVNDSGVSFRKNDGSGDYRYSDLSGKRFIFTVLFTTTA